MNREVTGRGKQSGMTPFRQLTFYPAWTFFLLYWSIVPERIRVLIFNWSPNSTPIIWLRATSLVVSNEEICNPVFTLQRTVVSHRQACILMNNTNVCTDWIEPGFSFTPVSKLTGFDVSIHEIVLMHGFQCLIGVRMSGHFLIVLANEFFLERFPILITFFI